MVAIGSNGVLGDSIDDCGGCQMTGPKIIEVHTCGDCPFVDERLDSGLVVWFSRDPTPICENPHILGSPRKVDLSTLPKWCPLEDIK